jgi:sulfoquinovose isomerase
VPQDRRVAGLDEAALIAETHRLLDFGQRFPSPEGGSFWLDSRGEPDRDRPVFTYSTARMAHVYSLGGGLGRPDDLRLADEAVRGLTGRLHDDVHGGWYAAIGPDGEPDGEKACYAHAFVVLAASSATLAQRPGAALLLQDSLAVWQDRFFDDEAEMFVDSWDRSFTTLQPYRGANANMHAVEALLAAADATADPALLDQALGIARRIVGEFAEPQHWRIPEHFTPEWQPMLEYHREEPDHPFQPYGATVGHGFEWSRLLLHVEAALAARAPGWLLPASVALFDRAVADGWFTDGRPGFVYTTDWDGTPVVRDRMWWVAAEAVAAAAALHRRTGDTRYADLAATWWAFIEQHHLDREHGSWIHQLDERNAPTDTVWPGKPDLYHAVQATLLPRYPLAPCLAASLAAEANPQQRS